MPLAPSQSEESAPITVWRCAQKSAPSQRRGRYVPASTRHPGKMLPDLARRIISEYTAPGELVVDPMCGIGTTMVEACLLGRRSIGVELEARWAQVARENIRSAVPPELRRLAEVRVGDARELPTVLQGEAGTIDSIVLSPPYGCTVGMIDRDAWLSRQANMCAPDTRNYSDEASNLGHARGELYAAGMADVYRACHRILRPGGVIVTVTKNMRRKGGLLDNLGLTASLLSASGFTYLQHIIALHAGVHDGGLRARPSFWQTTQTRQARGRGLPVHLVVHEDVLVFRKPEGEANHA